MPTTLLGFTSLQDEKDFHNRLTWVVVYASLPVFLALLFIIPSPYGKSTSRHSENFWGPMIPARLAWFLLESPNLLWSVVCLLDRCYWHRHNHPPLDSVNEVLLIVFVLHYLQRALLYPLFMKPSRKPFPLVTCASAFIYCHINGYLQARSLCEFDNLGNSLADPIVVIGICVLLGGAALNLHSDAILRTLSAEGPGYRIPHGGGFHWVSTPHFTGEILEWFGYCIASHFSISSVSFWLFTCSNLIPRGVAHHQWYLESFGKSYPPRRKAILPFLW